MDMNQYFYFIWVFSTVHLLCTKEQNLITIASRWRRSGATCAHAIGYLWAVLINTDEAHMRRKNLPQCLYLPAWPSVLSSHCLLKQQDHVLTFTTQPPHVHPWQCGSFVYCALNISWLMWCKSYRESDGRREEDYFSVALRCQSCTHSPVKFFFFSDKVLQTWTELKLSLHTSTSRLRSLDTLFLGPRFTGQDESHMAHKNFTEHTNKLTHD